MGLLYLRGGVKKGLAQESLGPERGGRPGHAISGLGTANTKAGGTPEWGAARAEGGGGLDCCSVMEAHSGCLVEGGLWGARLQARRQGGGRYTSR